MLLHLFVGAFAWLCCLLWVLLLHICVVAFAPAGRLIGVRALRCCSISRVGAFARPWFLSLFLLFSLWVLLLYLCVVAFAPAAAWLASGPCVAAPPLA